MLLSERSKSHPVYSLFYFDDRSVPHCGSLVAEEVYGSSRNVGESVACVLDYAVPVSIEVIVYDAGNGVERMAGLSLGGAVLAPLSALGLLV